MQHSANPFPPDTVNYYAYYVMETRDRMQAGELLISDVKMAEAVKRAKRQAVTNVGEV